MMSGPLVKMAENAKKMAGSVKGSNGLLAQSYDEIRNRIRGVEDSIAKSRSVGHIRELRSELTQLQRMAVRAPGNMDRGGGWLGGLFRQALPMLGIASALTLGGSVLNAGLTAQARQTSFEVMAGKTQGTALNQDLTKYVQQSIYGNEVYQNAQTMMGFGIEAKNVLPSIKMLGDIAMGDADKLGRLTLAFSQVKAAGKLMGQDLLQFVNAGFNPLQIMSEKTGVSLGVLREKMSDGLITFDMVKQAFESATGPGGRFYDMTNKIAQTDFGKWQAFKGQLEGLAMQLGGLIAPAFGWLIQNALVPFVNLLSASVEWIKQNSEWLQPLAIGLLAAAGAYGLFTLALNAGAIATGFMTGAMKILNLVMMLNPVGLIIAGVAALVAVVIYAWNKFDGFRGTVMALWEVMKAWGTLIKDYVIDKVVSLLSLIGSLGDAIGKLFKGDFSGAWETAQSAFKTYGAAGDMANQKARNTYTEGGKSALAAYRAEFGKKAENPMEAAATPGGASFGSGGFGDLSTDADGTAKGIAGGGPRVININGVKFTDKVEIHTATAPESADELQRIFEEMFLRVLNSGARIQ